MTGVKAKVLMVASQRPTTELFRYLAISKKTIEICLSFSLSLVDGKAAGLDTCFFTSYGLARSTTCGSVSTLQVGGQSTYVSLHVTR